jgi:hypothetical protein
LKQLKAEGKITDEEELEILLRRGIVFEVPLDPLPPPKRYLFEYP